MLPLPKPGPPAGAERLVHVVRDEVELPLRVAVEAVVAGPNPVAVVVDEGDVQGQEPEQAVDVEDRLEGGFELVGGVSLSDLAQR